MRGNGRWDVAPIHCQFNSTGAPDFGSLAASVGEIRGLAKSGAFTTGMDASLSSAG
jgi:hypothetical protein